MNPPDWKDILRDPEKNEGGIRMGIGQEPTLRPLGIVAMRLVWMWKAAGPLFKVVAIAVADELHRAVLSP
jgi:hypothetical protein